MQLTKNGGLQAAEDHQQAESDLESSHRELNLIDKSTSITNSIDDGCLIKLRSLELSFQSTP